MAEAKATAALVGCTGLVGSHILTTLLALSSQPTVHALARRNLDNPSPNLKPHIEKDSEKWPETVTSIAPTPSIFLSALGTTRAQAGSIEAQRKIDYDLNLALARSAQKAGVKVYVLISSDGTSKNSLWPYGKMKAELEEAVGELGFPHCVILRPGLLVGNREELRAPEAVLRNVAKGLGLVSGGILKDVWAQDADVVARAAVAAGMQCVEGKREEGVWRVNQATIIKFGRTEWKGDA